MSRFSLCCLVASVLVLGGSPVVAQDPHWKFLVYSDSQAPDYLDAINTNLLRELVRVTLREQPDVVLFGGDFANTPTLSGFQEWTNIMAPVYEAGIAVLPVLGNHDVSDSASYVAVLGPTIPDNGPTDELKRTYFVRHKNALFLMLDTYNLLGNKTLRVNQAWVEAVLATNSSPHVFAMGHTPAFQILHRDCLGTYPERRDLFWNALSNANARVYFSGHDHFYDHARLDDGDGFPENDLHQIVVGTGGGYLYPDDLYNGTNGIWTPRRILHEASYGYVSVAIDGPRVTARWNKRTGPDQFDPTSEVFSYVSGPPEPKLGFVYDDGHLWLRWLGSAMLQESSSPDGPFSDLESARPPFPADTSKGETMYYRLRPTR